MTPRGSETGTEIPLSLIPQVIACQIRKRGAKVLNTKIERRIQRLTELERGERS